MAYNQLIDFLDSLDTATHRHLLMLYEEPEYAKLIQMRFINDGLKKGECGVYAAQDDGDLLLTKTEMAEYGIDVDYYSKKGLLQFHMRKPQINNTESYKRARSTFQEEIEKAFLCSQDHPASTLPKIRGVGSMFRDVFVKEENEGSKKATAATQLLIERLFQYEDLGSFDGVWMCAYQIGDIFAGMNEEWMGELLVNHDAVLFLPRLSNGIALNLKK